jgi:hypothetical protein
MSARSAKQTEKILKDRMPGYTLSRGSSKYTKRQASSRASGVPQADMDAGPRARAPRVDSTTPSIADLRKKFLRSASDSDAAPEAMEFAREDDADIVLVEPTHGPAGKRRAKAVVIDGQGRILGAQG